MNSVSVKSELKKLANKKKAKILSGFFKTGKGQYGEGDVFLGITVPQQRAIAKKYKDLPLKEVIRLLHSKEHEYRLTALLILVAKYESSLKYKSTNGSPLAKVSNVISLRNVLGGISTRNKIFNAYLQNTKWINNWDLIDLTAPKIVGAYLIEMNGIKSARELNKSINFLKILAKSKSLWERRIAILSTFAFIYKGEHRPTFYIAKMLMSDEQDLIHKAVGWMLREVGKRCGREPLVSFLKVYGSKMARTSYRYATEHF
jgi:3-methyladenine DNA glycosylase AlkD